MRLLLMRFVKIKLVIGVSLISLSQIFAAPKAEIWPYWEKYDPKNMHVINHEPWQEFLNTYVEASLPIYLVNYAAVTPQHRQMLEDYLSALQLLRISIYNRKEQQAYWINFYNALTVKVILDHYPVKSITKISYSFFSFGPWDEKLVKVEGQTISLNDIEHRILRPIWKDNRVHYALNCASMGCPNLQPNAFTPPTMERMLDSATRAYVNHERGASFVKGKLRVSSIYTWYRADFGGNSEGIIAHLKQYAEGTLAESLKTYRGSLDDAYDWNLNQP